MERQVSEVKYATPEGTARYRDKFRKILAEDHFRLQQGLWMSSIGLGTYLGTDDDDTDRSYTRSVVRALELGTNVIDSAVNYRFQRSERAVGVALRALFDSGKVNRDEVIIATKGGFLPFENHAPESQEEMQDYVERQFIRPGILLPEDIVAGCHSLKPQYLQNQLDLSLQNLGLKCIDIYYVHNPETQLSEVPREEFYRRMLKAFEVLEFNVAVGRIRMYGMATWNAHRVPSNAKDYLSLREMVDLAKTVGGEEHHFKVVQLPFNLAMPEAFGFWNQRSGEQPTSTLKLAEELGLTVMASASLLQAQLAQNLPSQIAESLGGSLQSDAQRAIQFTRSTPGISVALVGMSRPAHVEHNLALGRISPLPFEQYRKLFKEPSAQ
jgi:aryl-alcohol dehydrogenase-like predicted oxidoreductase